MSSQFNFTADNAKNRSDKLQGHLDKIKLAEGSVSFSFFRTNLACYQFLWDDPAVSKPGQNTLKRNHQAL